MSKFTKRLAQDGFLIADGATGTMLHKAGLPAGAVNELWNLENPQAVRDLHRSYIDAGSNVILTNTFGGTRFRLEHNHLGDRVREINRIAAQLAREAAGDQIFVFGDIGPTGQLMKPFGALTYEEAVAAFQDQAAGLVDGGVDAILIETMSDLNEAKAALEAARQVSDLPILVTLSFESHGRTMMGVKPENAARELWNSGATVIGANCGRTLSETLAAIEAMRKAVPEAILMAKPNAGLPKLDLTEGDAPKEVVYDVTPEIMAEYACKFADQGVKILGGCCGSTPDHIRAIADMLR